MPIDIEGWIEFSPYENKEERNDEHSWISWMDISTMIYFNDEVNWILIGNPRNFNSKNSKYQPIAKNRGFPKNPSQYLKIDIDWISQHQVEYGEGGLFGFTFLNYTEIEKINWEKDYQINIKESDWGKLFELINKFKDLKKIKSEQLRIVAWYNW